MLTWVLRNGVARAAVVAGMVGVGLPSAASAMSLEEAIEIAIETNPEVAAASGNRRAIGQELRQARSFYLPQLSVSAEAGPARINDSSTRATGGDEYVTGSREVYQATLRQRLFDGFETDSQVARDKARLRSAAFSVYDTAEFLALDVANQYLEVQRQRELLEIARDNVAVHEEILGLVRDRLDRGAGSTADVSQTQARLFQARSTVTERQRELRDALARFQRLVGQPPGELQEVAALDDALPANERAALQVAVDNNPNIRARQADVEAAEARIGVAESDLYPDVNLEAQSIYRDDTDSIQSYEREHRLMLQFEWTLFAGGRNVASRNEAIERASQARAERMTTMREVREELRRSWNALRETRRRVREQRQVVEANRETRNAYRDQFQVGQRTLLDVLDAENELFTARGQLATARVNRKFATYRIVALTGNLMPTLGVEPPATATPEAPGFTETLIPDSPGPESSGRDASAETGETVENGTTDASAE